MPDRLRTPLATLLLVLLAAPVLAGPNPELRAALAPMPPSAAPSGVLLDRVVVLSTLPICDGGPDAPLISAASLRQMLHELHGAASEPRSWPRPDDLRPQRREDEAVPLALINLAHHRLRRDALVSGDLIVTEHGLTTAPGVNPTTLARPGRVFAAAPLAAATLHGRAVTFTLPARLLVTDTRLDNLAIDLDDGAGWRPLSPDRPLTATYATTGPRTLRLRARLSGGEVLTSRSRFEVIALDTPAPSETWPITATTPYGGAVGTGDAYVYLAEGHDTLTAPVVVVEGFDLDDSLGWPELYALLNQENLLEDLRAAGLDAVVLDFTESTAPIQRNAFVVTELLAAVEAAAPGQPYTLVGASMGGLVSRYALCHLEANATPHAVHTFLSFDGAQNGANIPLGLQHWLAFFQGESAEAAYMLGRLDTPAARQMLLYHHASADGDHDPSFGELMAELADLGDWPAQPRLAALANGSGNALDQGYAPGAQLVSWEYESLLVDIVGNIWAVPDHTAGTIFHGLIDLIWPLPDTEQTVTVNGLRPLDAAPGGWRPSLAQLADTSAPYGDIVALHPDHAFIPTVSALAVASDDVFLDLAGQPDPLALTPFDAIYFPAANEEHVFVTPAGKEWIMAEILGEATGVARPLAAAPMLFTARPNPFNPRTVLRFAVPDAGPVNLDVFDVRGRHVRTLVREELPAGDHAAAWNGRDDDGRAVAAGTYLVKLAQGGRVVANRVTLLK